MNWLRRLFSRRRIYGELSEEIRAHLDEKVEERVARGMTRDEAMHTARREFGNVTLAEEDSRGVWRWALLEEIFVDVRYALRALRRNPGFTAVAVLTLALGIGANTALFSVIDAVLLRPLPFRDPGRLVALRSPDLKDVHHGGEISYPAFLDWRTWGQSLEGLSVWNTMAMTYMGGDQAESIRSAVVSANLFSLLGASPVLGRGFVESEDRAGAEQLPVVLSYEFWQSHFGGNADVLGRAITLDHGKYTVVGVMPAGFEFPVSTERVELWTTIAHDLSGSGMATQRGLSYLSMIARLKPRIAIPQAQADLKLVQDGLNRQYPDSRPRGVTMRSESDEISGAMKPALLVLLGAVGFVLLIACANVASLLLARAAVRRREFVVRITLGASRWILVRQLLTESLLLAMAGGIVGLVVAHWGASALLAVVPAGLARAGEVAVDWRVLGFTFAVAVMTGLAFGLVPALQASATRGAISRVEGGRGVSSGPAGMKLRRALVAVQVMTAFVLLIGAGLLVRSFAQLCRVDPGFRADHVLTFLLDISPPKHAREKRAEFVQRLLQSTRALPGVKSASAIFGLPLSADQAAFTALEIEGRPVPKSQLPRVAFRIVESNYFQCMGIRLVHGRVFTDRDEQGGPPLAIVNETFARQIFPGEDPVGRRIQPNVGFGSNHDALVREIVGVTGDVRSSDIADPAVPEVYIPQTPTDFIGEMSMVVRTETDPKAMVPMLRSMIASLDKELPMRDVKTLEEYVSGSISGTRFEAVLLGTFAGLAFALTIIGLYGVISYTVAQRTREIGIRMALGAQQASISQMVIGEGALLALAGIGAGLVASLFAVRLIRDFLYGVGPSDPVTFVAVPVLLLGVALLASYIPARRAMRVDPMMALRYE